MRKNPRKSTCENCKAENCRKITRGYCIKCYRRYFRSGFKTCELIPDPARTCSNCKKEGCYKMKSNLCVECSLRLEKNGHFDKICEFPNSLTDEQISIIEGHIIGDAYMKRLPLDSNEQYRNGCSSFHIVRSASDIRYLEWTIGKLNNLCLPNVLPLSIQEKTDTRPNKGTYYSVAFYTRSLTILNSFRTRWYDANGVKFVPKDLKLDPIMISVWICDDGCIRIKNNQITISFYTNGFTKIDVAFLVSLLNERYNTTFCMQKKRSTSGLIQYIIVAHSYAAVKVIRDIDSVFPQCMNRKRIWTESMLVNIENSKRSYNRKERFDSISLKIFQYLKDRLEFSRTKMCRELGLMRKPNKKGKIICVNILCHIKQLVDSEYIILKSNKLYEVNYIITPLGEKYFSGQMT